MAEYLIQEETLASIADQIRILNGTEGAMTTAVMDSSLGEANTEVSDQSELIDQITSALEGKAAGSGGNTMEICTGTIKIMDYYNSDAYIEVYYINGDGLREEYIDIPSNEDYVSITINVVKNSLVCLFSGTLEDVMQGGRRISDTAFYVSEDDFYVIVSTA